MASQGPFLPGTGATLSNAGSSENAEAWVTPSNVTNVGTETQITAATYDTPDISQLLVGSNFPFAIPGTATIDGIVVVISRRCFAGSASDNRVQLAKGTTFASLVGDNKAATTTAWPATLGGATYGASNDLWGTTWTPAEINDSSFAVFMSVQADSNNTDVGVDLYQVTIHYTDAPAAFQPRHTGTHFQDPAVLAKRIARGAWERTKGGILVPRLWSPEGRMA